MKGVRIKIRVNENSCFAFFLNFGGKDHILLKPRTCSVSFLIREYLGRDILGSHFKIKNKLYSLKRFFEEE